MADDADAPEPAAVTKPGPSARRGKPWTAEGRRIELITVGLPASLGTVLMVGLAVAVTVRTSAWPRICRPRLTGPGYRVTIRGKAPAVERTPLGQHGRLATP